MDANSRLVDKTSEAVRRTPAWSFDVTTGMYMSVATGKLLAPQELRKAVEGVVAGAQEEAERITRSMAAGKLSPHDWHERMELLVVALLTAASAAGTAGIPGMVEQAQRDLRAAIAREKAHLAGFLGVVLAVGALAGIATAVTDQEAMWVSRARSYMGAGLMEYERARYALMDFLDFTEGKREVHPEAEHCEGCLHEAGKGWVSLRELKPLGLEECGQWCACTVEYRKVRIYATTEAV